MVSEYDIYMGNKKVGIAMVERLGLYYCFDCRCRLPEGTLCRVVAEDNGRHENLGILVPQGGAFTLSTKLPIKRFADEIFSFRVIPKHPSGQGFFAPVYPDEPFGYISRLKNAFLEIRNGQLGVRITDPDPSPQGSDPNP